MKTCRACGYVRHPDDTAPDYECPKCGRVYAKTDAPASQPRATVIKGHSPSDEDVPSRASSTGWLKLAGVVFVSAMIGAGYFTYAERQAKEAERAANRASIDAIVAAANRWDDAVKLAQSTPRIALAGPLGSMQSLRREVETMSVSACVIPARDALASAMTSQLNGFLAFMGQNESEARSHMEAADRHLQNTAKLRLACD